MNSVWYDETIIPSSRFKKGTYVSLVTLIETNAKGSKRLRGFHEVCDSEPHRQKSSRHAFSEGEKVEVRDEDELGNDEEEQDVKWWHAMVIKANSVSTEEEKCVITYKASILRCPP